jgi:hypothetical protein
MLAHPCELHEAPRTIEPMVPREDGQRCGKRRRAERQVRRGRLHNRRTARTTLTTHGQSRLYGHNKDELYVAGGFPLQSSAGSHPVEVAIEVELEQIPWIIARATRDCSLSPRESKPLKLKTLHIRINELEPDSLP